MRHGTGIWWFALITQLIVLAAALGAVIYIGWINYTIKRDHKRWLAASAESTRRALGTPTTGGGE